MAGAPRGLIDGIPVGIKDNLLVAGMPLYLTSRVEHLAAMAEAAMLQAFDTRRAVRVFLRNGRVLLSGDPARSNALESGYDPRTALEIVPLGGGAISSGDSISMRSSSGEYLSVWRDANADLTAIASQSERYETFCIERVDGLTLVVLKEG